MWTCGLLVCANAALATIDNRIEWRAMDARVVIAPICSPEKSGARRDGEAEDAAVARDALDPNSAAVELDDDLTNRQAESGAAVGLCIGRLDLAEPFEDPLTRFGRYAAPMITNREGRDAARITERREKNPSIGGRKLDRVADEVREHLHDAIVIGVDGCVGRLDLEDEILVDRARRRGVTRLGHD